MKWVYDIEGKLIDQILSYQRITSDQINIVVVHLKSIPINDSFVSYWFVSEISYPGVRSDERCMHELRVGKGFCLLWKPRIFCTAFGDSRFSVWYLVRILGLKEYLIVMLVDRVFFLRLVIWLTPFHVFLLFHKFSLNNWHSVGFYNPWLFQPNDCGIFCNFEKDCLWEEGFFLFKIYETFFLLYLSFSVLFYPRFMLSFFFVNIILGTFFLSISFSTWWNLWKALTLDNIVPMDCSKIAFKFAFIKSFPNLKTNE